MHYYIDNGFSGNRFDRPAFQQTIQDILAGKIECIVVKDLSRFGRDYITVG
ncbi:MAG: recombinase family protein, partial [Oscillibacter sp.]|nr:recombinase family protein [Oscillibacter sp.]